MKTKSYLIIRKFIAVSVLLIAVLALMGLYWEQEVRFTLPTPIPEGYENVVSGTQIHLPALLPGQFSEGEKQVYLHFYNPECPCSRFNLKHFDRLREEYQGKLPIVVVIPAYADDASLEHEFAGLPVIKDETGKLAAVTGVYSTPQAVLIKNNQLYFRGNYNKARFCTTPNSNYAQIAIDSLLKGADAPVFGPYATESYGCSFRTEDSPFTGLASLLTSPTPLTSTP